MDYTKLKILIRPGVCYLLLLLPVVCSGLLAVDYFAVFLPRALAAVGAILLAWGIAVLLQFHFAVCRLAAAGILIVYFGGELLELFSFILSGRSFDMESMNYLSISVLSERLSRFPVYFAAAGLYFLVTAALIIRLIWRTPKVRRYQYRLGGGLLAGGVLLLLICTSPFSSALAVPLRLPTSTGLKTEELAEYGIKPTLLHRSEVDARPGHNLVLILLGGVEDSFLYQTDFPDLLTNLFRFVTVESMWFSAIREARYGDPGFDGVYAALTGSVIPEVLRPSLLRGSELSSLPHILHRAGYFQVGIAREIPESDVLFDFFSREKYDEVMILDSVERGGEQTNDLFGQALRRYEELSAGGQPFNLTVKIEPPEYCRADGSLSPDGLKRLDLNLNELIGKMKLSARWPDTRVILATDHLAAENPLPANADRKLIFIMLNAGLPGRFEADGKIFDLAPTILHILGVEHNYDFPLGENLFFRTDPRRLSGASAAAEALLVKYLRLKLSSQDK